MAQQMIETFVLGVFVFGMSAFVFDVPLGIATACTWLVQFAHMGLTWR